MNKRFSTRVLLLYHVYIVHCNRFQRLILLVRIEKNEFKQNNVRFTFLKIKDWR